MEVTTGQPTPSGGWRQSGQDPNDPGVIGARRDALARAWRPETRSRIELIVDFCRGQRVLDLGCVDHDAGLSTAKPSWLHSKIREVAGECVGADFERDGVAQLNAQGFDVVEADVTGDPAALAGRGPFDVVVAGELIEHLGRPEALLSFASAALAPGGRLLVTTPNPFAPWRVALAQRAAGSESVDHVVLLFPSGMLELADRNGMTLEWYTSVEVPYTAQSLGRSLKGLAKALVQRSLGVKAIVPRPLDLPLEPQYASPLVWWQLRSRGRRAPLGETNVYVLRRDPAPAGG